MNISTKTGLIASPRKHIVRPRKEFDPAVLAPCAITRQVPLALRPFGGLYNPYSKGCSVLCNHPAAQELKNVVRLAKDAWITDARTVHSEKLLMGGQGHGSGKQPDGSKRMMSKDSDLPDHVPEEFFRRYTDTDSRPLTPTPTVASGRTRASVVGGSHLTRRCVTPEPQTQNLQERKQLILDLRRSHSQETLYWNASSELSPSQLQDPSWMQHHSQIPETVDERVLGGDGAESDKEDRQGKPTPMTCINAMEDGEEDPPRRRGKRRKKSKQLPQTISFTPNQDPETAVATIDPDSPNYSARPSLVPTGRSLLSSGAESPPRASVEEQIEYIECFLDDEALCLLRRGLNIDIVESVFERYVRFLRYLPLERYPKHLTNPLSESTSHAGSLPNGNHRQAGLPVASRQAAGRDAGHPRHRPREVDRPAAQVLPIVGPLRTSNGHANPFQYRY